MAWTLPKSGRCCYCLSVCIVVYMVNLLYAATKAKRSCRYHNSFSTSHFFYFLQVLLCGWPTRKGRRYRPFIQRQILCVLLLHASCWCLHKNAFMNCRLCHLNTIGDRPTHRLHIGLYALMHAQAANIMDRAARFKAVEIGLYFAGSR